MTSERELIMRAKKGDTRAFEYLMNQHAQYVFNLVYRLVNNREEAEDLSQDVFINAWRKIGTFRGDAQFKTWLYRIATNLCYNRMPTLKRDMASMAVDHDMPLVSKTIGVESALEASEQSQELNRAIQTLPENYRLLLILRHVQEFSYNEIAEITNTPLGTVKTGIFRARQMLKERLLAMRQ